MRIVLICLLAIVALIGASPRAALAEDGAWTKIYSRPASDVTEIAMFDGEHGVALAGFSALRTVDGGATWTEAQPPASIASGHVKFADGQRAWAVTLGGGIWRTNDGGSNWRRQESGTSVHFNSIAVINANEAWAVGAGEGFGDRGPVDHPPSVLLHTTDAGYTWRNAPAIEGANTFQDVAFAGKSGWLVASQCHPGEPFFERTPGAPACRDVFSLFQTTNAGKTWTKLASPPAVVPQRMQWLDAKHGFGVANACNGQVCGEQIYASSDGGKTWELRAIDTDRVLNFAFQSATAGWALVQFCGGERCVRRLARTSDGGTTWRFVEIDVAIEPGFGRTFAVTPSHLIIAGGPTGFALLDLKTGIWSQSPNDTRPTFSSLAFATRDRGYTAAVDGQLWVTDDGGAHWTAHATPLPLIGVAVGGDVLWGVMRCEICLPALFVSADGGVTWDRRTLPASASSISVAPFDAMRAWYRADDGLWRTDDGGLTWQHLEATPSVPDTYHFIDHDNGWTGYCPSSFCDRSFRVTSDGGETWHIRSLPNRATVQFFLTPLLGWATRYGDDPANSACRCRTAVLRTVDGGETWEDVGDPGIQANGLVFIDARRGWMAGYGAAAVNGSILATSDGGTTWTREFSPDASSSAAVLTAGNGRIWAWSQLGGDPYSAGATNIYRRDFVPSSVPSPVPAQPPVTRGLRPPDTGGGPASARNDPARFAALLAIAGAVSLALGAVARRRPI